MRLRAHAGSLPCAPSCANARQSRDRRSRRQSRSTGRFAPLLLPPSSPRPAVSHRLSAQLYRRARATGKKRARHAAGLGMRMKLRGKRPAFIEGAVRDDFITVVSGVRVRHIAHEQSGLVVSPLTDDLRGRTKVIRAAISNSQPVKRLSTTKMASSKRARHAVKIIILLLRQLRSMAGSNIALADEASIEEILSSQRHARATRKAAADAGTLGTIYQSQLRQLRRVWWPNNRASPYFGRLSSPDRESRGDGQ